MDRRTIGPAHQRAHRFARRRMDWALTLGTTLPTVDPARSARRCTLASFAVAVALLAGSGVLAIARPAPDWRSAQVLIDPDSGAVFVNRNGTVHPVLNLTSALLVTETPTIPSPQAVSAADLAAAPRGPLLGIAGAPAQLPTRDRLFTGDWSVCDERPPAGQRVVSTAVVGVTAPGSAVPPGDAVLVAGVGAAPTAAFLLWAGRRIPVDLTDRALVQALGLVGAAPRPVSAAVLAAVPPAPPVALTIPAGSGRPGAVDIPDATGAPVAVGTVLQVRQAGGRISLQLVHQDGVETITPVVADLLVARSGGLLVTIDAWQLAEVPATREASVATAVLPPSAPRLAAAEPLLCATWRGAADGWAVTTGTSLDATLPVLPVTSLGRRVDQVQIRPAPERWCAVSSMTTAATRRNPAFCWSVTWA